MELVRYRLHREISGSTADQSNRLQERIRAELREPIPRSVSHLTIQSRVTDNSIHGFSNYFVFEQRKPVADYSWDDRRKRAFCPH